VSDSKILFLDSQGRSLTGSDLANLSETVNWGVYSDSQIPAEAQRLHDLGRAAGQRGEYQIAVKFFERAAKIAPDWPYPVYDHAYTRLLLGDCARAYALYLQVDGMAPRGFFSVKTAIFCLLRESQGLLPVGTYLEFVKLESIDDTTVRAVTVTRMTQALPLFAPGWKARASRPKAWIFALSIWKKVLPASATR